MVAGIMLAGSLPCDIDVNADSGSVKYGCRKAKPYNNNATIEYPSSSYKSLQAAINAKNAAIQAALKAENEVKKAEADAKIAAVSHQPPEGGQILRSGNNQYLADSGLHQHRNRIIYHRLVIDREQLLADPFCDWIEPGSAAAGEDDTLHK